MTTMVTQHRVEEYGPWRVVYEEAAALRAQHGCTAERVWRSPDDANNVLVLHEFPTLAQAQAFVGDPGLKDAMGRAGVAGPPRIELWEDVDG
jgi:quinol monooxygenase YgiN